MRGISSIGSTNPVTALAFVEPLNILLAGSAPSLIATSPRQPRRKWNVFVRERVHRILVGTGTKDEGSGAWSWRVLVLGGKEAVLLSLTSPGAAEEDGPPRLSAISLSLLARFALPDWCHDCSFLTEERSVFITAHNSVLVYSSCPPVLIETRDASARPLLWAASFSKPSYAALDDLVVAGGTMWGEVLLWSVRSGELQTLNGHSGAVYSISFSPSGHELATCSDDRTLRTWAIITSESTCTRTLWGHEGRVWRVRWIDAGHLVSVAEDSTCKIWRLNESDYTLLKTFKENHDGRSLWSVAATVLPGGWAAVATGGADGGVQSHVVSLQNSLATEEGSFIDIPASNGAVRAFTFLASSGEKHSCLFITTSLHLVALPLSSGPPSLLHSSPSLSTPTILHLTHQYAWAYSARGTLVRVDRSTNEAAQWETGIGANIAVWLADRKIAVFEQKGGRICILELDGEDGSPAYVVSSTLELKSAGSSPATSKSDKISSLAFLDEGRLLVFGTAEGDVGVVELSNPTATLLARHNVHEKVVTDIHVVESANSSEHFKILTCGREGYKADVVFRRAAGLEVVGKVSLIEGTLEKILSSATPPLFLATADWTASLLNDDGNKLVSFASRLIKIPSSVVETPTSFHYYRAVGGRIHHQSAPKPPVSPMDPNVLQGFHGREIRSIKFHRAELGKNRFATLIATAAENPRVKISQLDANGEPRTLFTDSTLPGALKSVQWSKSHRHLSLFASGARETIRAWRVVVSVAASEKKPSVPTEVNTKVEVHSIGSSAHVSESGEVRVMDLEVVRVDTARGLHLVAAGYSDGFLRIWSFDDESGEFALLGAHDAHKRCILSVRCAQVELGSRTRHLVFSGSSDGLLAAWDVTELVDRELSCPDLSPLSKVIHDLAVPRWEMSEPIVSFRPHPSGINALDVALSGPSLDIASGGDDNAIAVHRGAVSLGDDDRIAILISDKHRGHPNAHASTIQGLAFLTRTLLVSSSVDARVNVYTISNEKLSLVEGSLSTVLDCSAMDAVRTAANDGWLVGVVGIGGEFLNYRGRPECQFP